ncbi:Zn-dependent exopeptidase [Flagelloscypha sp. PMI_526]|nr:Zn-dependent exopeptidase [Flagelloscypha sp. PMI_526]
MRSSLLLTLASAPYLPNSPCLSAESFRGIFKDGDDYKSLFTSVSSECLFSDSTLDSGHVVDHNSASQLVWLERAPVDPSLVRPTYRDEVDAFLETLSSHMAIENPTNQQIPIQARAPPELLYRSPSAALISVDKASAFSADILLPNFWKSTLVSPESVSFLPVPTNDSDRVQKILDGLTFSPEIASIVNSLSLNGMVNDIAYLTGESPLSNIVSRHSFAEGSRLAAAWLKDQFEQTGAECELIPFLEGFAPDVICRYSPVAPSNETFILGAHYDSRGTFGSTSAPGGDDDGSGTISLLGIAKAIRFKRLRFKSHVELALFAGEEQGLLGSRAYAKELRAAGKDVTFMIQADMLAYHDPEEPMQLGLPASIGTPAVTNLVGNVSKIYSPELTVGITGACCSDHQSFHEQGYAATQVFERAGWIIDPMYHNSGDVSKRPGYDFNQLRSIAKVQFATLLHGAGYEIVQ